jgi:hypothetical protein
LRTNWDEWEKQLLEDLTHLDNKVVMSEGFNFNSLRNKEPYTIRDNLFGAKRTKQWNIANTYPLVSPRASRCDRDSKDGNTFQYFSTTFVSPAKHTTPVVTKALMC